MRRLALLAILAFGIAAADEPVKAPVFTRQRDGSVALSEITVLHSKGIVYMCLGGYEDIKNLTCYSIMPDGSVVEFPVHQVTET